MNWPIAFAILLAVVAFLPVAVLVGLCVLIVAGWMLDRTAA